jgi:hypothetical protein
MPNQQSALNDSQKVAVDAPSPCRHMDTESGGVFSDAHGEVCDYNKSVGL